jgi:serine/threonine-protein kinase SRPK3
VLGRRNMNGATDIKKAVVNKTKQVTQAAAQNGNGGKKRRKGQDLKPIITTEQGKSQEASPASSANSFSFA